MADLTQHCKAIIPQFKINKIKKKHWSFLTMASSPTFPLPVIPFSIHSIFSFPSWSGQHICWKTILVLFAKKTTFLWFLYKWGSRDDLQLFWDTSSLEQDVRIPVGWGFLGCFSGRAGNPVGLTSHDCGCIGDCFPSSRCHLTTENGISKVSPESS